MTRAVAEPAAAPDALSEPCYHCGEPVPEGLQLYTEIGGQQRSMCCPGCQAVAAMIAGSGLDSFYQQRTAYSERPSANAEPDSSQYLIYDQPELAATFCENNDDGSVSARLLLGGITCAACTWLIEQTLAPVPGVVTAAVNLQQSRLDIRFDPQQLPLSEIFARVEALGYRPQPFQLSARREQLRAEYRADLRRLGVAGFGMMQVGMFAVALHAGDIQGIQEQYQGLLRAVSLLVSGFIVYYSAGTFFRTAWRHLKQGALVMDLPVALAIGLAWLASAYATFTGSGQVYFDSVVMFTFFLLLGRFLEARVRQRHASNWFDAQSSLPDAIRVRRGEQWLTVPRSQVERGEIMLVQAGQTIAADATVIAGNSAVREDTFNGEHLPRTVATGDIIYAGTLNVEAALEAEVLGSYAESRLAALQRSVEVAETEKPQLAKMADRIASWFVAGVLLVTSATAIAWWQIAPEQTLWVALSVLVISCPCALALATPAALTSAASALRTSGVIVRGENALEALSRTTHLLFDKTGTLTEGRLAVRRVELLGELDEQQALQLAAGLQHWSNHPVSKAFAHIESTEGFHDVSYKLGAGLQGSVNGQLYRIGSEAYCRELCPGLPPPPDDPLYWIALCNPAQALAWIGLDDQLRQESPAVVQAARAGGLTLGLLTGDSSPQGKLLAAGLGIDDVRTGMEPQQKMQRVQELQAAGAVVSMVGDGLNDAPVLSVADSSFAVAGATDLARTQADFVIVDDDLARVTETWNKARACRRIILQNFAWALGYNLSAIPLAATGNVPPWAAAIGMSLSSLLVVANSLRLNRRRAQEIQY
ncbi:heavy metal translocating P-type ATPase [Seongchinamella sediminis]|uniref:heavy metal translocating P-type ATPase n=1 Tax=Seongchinamella sediminis TaxID=2283635 RepID=UPI001EF0DE9F|nr:heavy metal translocating P-type ATPase [Seongchinamella sediminis]